MGSSHSPIQNVGLALICFTLHYILIVFDQMNRINGDDILNTILSVIFGFFYGIWKLISWIFSVIWKFFLDVLKNIYGRMVIIIGGVILLALIGYLTGFLHK